MKRKMAKEILAESFREVAINKSIDKITIQEIVDNCGYSPATFYRNFKDKYDLVAWDHTRGVQSIMEKIDSEYTWRQSLEDGAEWFYAQKDYLDVSYAYGGPLTTRHGRGFTHWAFIAPKEISSQSYAKYKERQKLFALHQAIADSRKEDVYAADIQAAAQVYLNADATVAELRAATRKLIVAVAEGLTSSIDVSDLFDNADMLGNATTTDWTTASTTIKDGNIEIFHKPFTLTQTQTDLPLGIYDIVLHAFYRNDNTDKAPIVAAKATNTVTGMVVERQTVADNEVMMTAAETTAGAAQTLTSDLAQTELTEEAYEALFLR